MFGNELPEAYEKFKECLNNDLDTPGAIAIFLGWMKKAKKNFNSKNNERFNLGLHGISLVYLIQFLSLLSTIHLKLILKLKLC